MGSIQRQIDAEERRQGDDVRLARYECLVYAVNLARDYGIPVSVLAATRREAHDRAIEIGWTGQASDARVAVLSITDVDL